MRPPSGSSKNWELRNKNRASDGGTLFFCTFSNLLPAPIVEKVGGTSGDFAGHDGRGRVSPLRDLFPKPVFDPLPVPLREGREEGPSSSLLPASGAA